MTRWFDVEEPERTRDQDQLAEEEAREAEEAARGYHPPKVVPQETIKEMDNDPRSIGLRKAQDRDKALGSSPTRPGAIYQEHIPGRSIADVERELEEGRNPLHLTPAQLEESMHQTRLRCNAQYRKDWLAAHPEDRRLL